MSIVSNRTRRPSHSATTHGRRRRRGGIAAASGQRGPRGSHGAAGALPEAAPGSPRGAGPSSGGGPERALDEVVLTTWAALLAGHPVECPVCGGPLTAAKGCSGCGARLT